MTLLYGNLSLCLGRRLPLDRGLGQLDDIERCRRFEPDAPKQAQAGAQLASPPFTRSSNANPLDPVSTTSDPGPHLEDNVRPLCIHNAQAPQAMSALHYV